MLMPETGHGFDVAGCAEHKDARSARAFDPVSALRRPLENDALAVPGLADSAVRRA
jgi:hypothetical protein